MHGRPGSSSYKSQRCVLRQPLAREARLLFERDREEIRQPAEPGAEERDRPVKDRLIVAGGPGKRCLLETRRLVEGAGEEERVTQKHRFGAIDGSEEDRPGEVHVLRKGGAVERDGTLDHYHVAQHPMLDHVGLELGVEVSVED